METVVRRLGQPPADWHLPTFAAGYMKREPDAVLVCPQSLHCRKHKGTESDCLAVCCAVDLSQHRDELMHSVSHDACGQTRLRG
jgi:hypothetical protein